MKKLIPIHVDQLKVGDVVYDCISTFNSVKLIVAEIDDEIIRFTSDENRYFRNKNGLIPFSKVLEPVWHIEQSNGGIPSNVGFTKTEGIVRQLTDEELEQQKRNLESGNLL